VPNTSMDGIVVRDTTHSLVELRRSTYSSTTPGEMLSNKSVKQDFMLSIQEITLANRISSVILARGRVKEAGCNCLIGERFGYGERDNILYPSNNFEARRQTKKMTLIY
jgi:hypothetical protein